MPRAGLAPASVTAAAADLADEVGIAQLSMGLLAQRLGVKAPSLYKHVDGLADLTRRIAELAATELADTIGSATQGRAGRDALAAGTAAMRRFVIEHPGRYAAGNDARAAGADDPLVAATRRLLDAWSAMLQGYRLDTGQYIHALRMLRSTLHGFVTFEVGGSFQIATEVDDSFTWIVDFMDRGLRAMQADERLPSEGEQRD